MVTTTMSRPAKYNLSEMSQFALWLLQASERVGKSAARVAEVAGLDRSYLNRLMNSHKPEYRYYKRPSYEKTLTIGEAVGDVNGALKAAGFEDEYQQRTGQRAAPEHAALYASRDPRLNDALATIISALDRDTAQGRLHERPPPYDGPAPQGLIAEARALEQVTRRSAADFRPGRAAPLGAGSVIWALDTEGRFLMSEGDDLPVENLKPGQAVGLRIWDVYRGEDDFLEKIRMVLASDSRLEWSATVRGNQWICQTEPLKDAQGNKIGIVGASVQRLAAASGDEAGTGAA